jgi:DNA-directed RNA polymerase subunit RPC12/RpoP
MSRNTLHRSKLGDFREWLKGDGWEMEQINGDYEVLRARKGQRQLLIYDRDGGDHYSYADTFGGIIRAFFKASKQTKATAGSEAQRGAKLVDNVFRRSCLKCGVPFSGYSEDGLTLEESCPCGLKIITKRSVYVEDGYVWDKTVQDWVKA